MKEGNDLSHKSTEVMSNMRDIFISLNADSSHTNARVDMQKGVTDCIFPQ